MEELKQATNGLLMMSETDYPFEIVSWKNLKVTTNYLREVSDQPEAAVEIESINDFFRAAATQREGMSVESGDLAKRYQHLIKVLEDNLSDVQVYRVGAVNIIIYAIGRSASGNWLGLSTRVVET